MKRFPTLLKNVWLNGGAMDKIIEELNRLKKEIESAKTNKAVLTDRIKENLKRLSDEMNLKSLEEADEWLAKSKLEIDKLREEIVTKFKKLKSEYEW